MEGRPIFESILDEIQNQELTETLMKYFDNGASLEKTAESMFTHKNTIKYRLNRIQEKTGLSLRQPDENFQLYLAVLALKLNEKVKYSEED